MTHLVLTFVGRDRPGLANAIATRIAAAGGTWLESRLAHLAGEFAGIVLVSLPDAQRAELAAAVRELEAGGLRIALEVSEAAPQAPAEKTYRLDLLGNERPGIVRDVTEALTRLGINIEDFSSGVEAAPFSGQEMFRATARLRAPDGVAIEDLRKTLERLAGEIMVDLTFGENGTPA